MRGSTGYIIGIILTIGIGAILQYFLCCGTGIAADNMNIRDEAMVAGMPFMVDDPESDFTINISDNFDFRLSSYSFLTPLSGDLTNSITSLRDFLSENKDVTLNITGFGYSSEDNRSAFPTLGEARANAVKSTLIENGISGNQLTVDGTLFDGTWSGQDSIVRGPISYALMRSMESGDGLEAEGDTAGHDAETEGGSTSEDFAEFVRDLQENPMVLHFETGSAYVNLSAGERQLISRLNQYIDQNAQAQIVIHGHTDNSGSPDVNNQLGKERAEFLKSYLVRNGFRPDRIRTISQGQSSPVASNDTPEGMAENRRAVLTIEN